MANIFKRIFDPKYNKKAQEKASEQLLELKKDLDKNVPNDDLIDVVSKMVDSSGDPVPDEVNKFHRLCDHFGDELANSKLDLNNILSDAVSSKNSSRSDDAVNSVSACFDSQIQIFEQLKELEFEAGSSFYQQLQSLFDQMGKEYRNTERNIEKIGKKDSLGGSAKEALSDLVSALQSQGEELDRRLAAASDVLGAGERVEKVKKKNEKGETVTIRTRSKTDLSLSRSKLTAPSVTNLINKATGETDAKTRAVSISKAVAALRGLVTQNLEDKKHHAKGLSSKKRINGAEKKFNALCSTLDRLAGNYRKADGDHDKFVSQNSKTLDKLTKQIQLVSMNLKSVGLPQNILKTANCIKDIDTVLSTGEPLDSKSTDSVDESRSEPSSDQPDLGDNTAASENTGTSDSSEAAEKTPEQLRLDNLYLKAAGGDMAALDSIRMRARTGNPDALDQLKKLANKDTSGVKLAVQQKAARYLFEFELTGKAAKKGKEKLAGSSADALRQEMTAADSYGSGSLRGLAYDNDEIFEKIDDALALHNNMPVRKLLENMLATREDVHGRKVRPPESVRRDNLQALKDMARGAGAHADAAMSVLRSLGCDYGYAEALTWYKKLVTDRLDLTGGLDADSKKLAVSALTDDSAWIDLAAKAINGAGAYRNAYTAIMAYPEMSTRKGHAAIAKLYTDFRGRGYAEDLCLKSLKAAGGVPGVSKKEQHDAIFDLYIQASRRIADPLAILQALAAAGPAVTNAVDLGRIHVIANLIQGAGADDDATETYARAVAIQPFRSVDDCAESAVAVFDLLADAHAAGHAHVVAIAAAFAARNDAWLLNKDILQRYQKLYVGLNALIADNAVDAARNIPTGGAMNAQGNVLAAVVANNNVFQATKSFCKIDGKSNGIDTGALDRLVALGASGVNEARYVLYLFEHMGADRLVNDVIAAVSGGGGAAVKNSTINSYTGAAMGVDIAAVWRVVDGLPVSAGIKDLVAGAMYIGYDISNPGATMALPGPKQNLTKLVFGAVAGDAGCIAALRDMAGKFAAMQPLNGMANKPNNDNGAVNLRFADAAGKIAAGDLFTRKGAVTADPAWAAGHPADGSEFAIALLEVTFKGQLPDGDMYNGADALSDAAFTKIKNAAKSNNADALKDLKILSTLGDANVDVAIKAEALAAYERYVAASKTFAKLGGKRGDAADRKEEMSKNRDRITDEEVKAQLEIAQLEADPNNRKNARTQLKTWADDNNPDNFDRRKDAALALRFLKEADAEAKNPAEEEADRVLTAAKLKLSLSDIILVHKSTFNTPDGLNARNRLLKEASEVGKSGSKFVDILQALSGAAAPTINAAVVQDYKSKLDIAKKRRADLDKRKHSFGYIGEDQTDYGDVVRHAKPTR